jgi:hypothetical protein
MEARGMNASIDWDAPTSRGFLGWVLWHNRQGEYALASLWIRWMERQRA